MLCQGQGGTGLRRQRCNRSAAVRREGRLAGIAAMDSDSPLDLIVVSGSSKDDTTNTRAQGGGGWTNMDFGNAAAAFYAALDATCPVCLHRDRPARASCQPRQPTQQPRPDESTPCDAAPNVVAFLDQLDPFGLWWRPRLPGRLAQTVSSETGHPEWHALRVRHHPHIRGARSPRRRSNRCSGSTDREKSARQRG